jgi:hypothetical protein
VHHLQDLSVPVSTQKPFTKSQVVKEMEKHGIKTYAGIRK